VGRDDRVLRELIGDCLRLKAALVERDEHDAGPRQVLNLGHTAGHAVEHASHARGRLVSTHGEAVAMGLLVELRLGERLGITDGGLGTRVAALLECLGFHAAACAIPASELGPYLRRDKKSLAGRGLCLPLVRRPGSIERLQDVPEAMLLEAFEAIRADGR
jgi:3-dehydroquinate synthetase